MKTLPLKDEEEGRARQEVHCLVEQDQASTAAAAPSIYLSLKIIIKWGKRYTSTEQRQQPGRKAKK